MEKNIVTAHWTWEAGVIWATTSDGRRVRTWDADGQFASFVDLLNAAPSLSAVLLLFWPSCVENVVS